MEAATAAAIGSASMQVANGVSNWFSGKKAQERAFNYNMEMQRQQNQFNSAAQQKAYEQNKALAEYAYDREREQWRLENQKNLDFWNMQNAYNSPQAQMERYQAAGLNPALIYGHDNTAGDLTAASSPSMTTHPAQAPEMSGGAGVSDNQRLQFGDPIREYYQVENMMQSLENSKAQNDVLKSQAFKNMVDALRGQTARDKELAGSPYWDENAKFDNVAKRLKNDISGATLAAMLFKNDNFLPLELERRKTLNSLLSQQLSFNDQANPLRIDAIKKSISESLSRTGYYNAMKEFTNNRQYTEFVKGQHDTMNYDFDKIYKDFVDGGQMDDSTWRRVLLYVLKRLFD